MRFCGGACQTPAFQAKAFPVRSALPKLRSRSLHARPCLSVHHRAPSRLPILPAPPHPQLIEAMQHALTGGGPRDSERDLRDQLREAEDEINRAAEVASTLASAFPALETQLRAIMLPATVGSSLAGPP